MTLRDRGSEFLGHLRVAAGPVFTPPAGDANDVEFGTLCLGDAHDAAMGAHECVYVATFGNKPNELSWEYWFPLSELATLTRLSRDSWRAYIAGPKNPANATLLCGLMQAGTSKKAADAGTSLWWELVLGNEKFYALHHQPPPESGWTFRDATACEHLNSDQLGTDAVDKTKLCGAAALLLLNNALGSGSNLTPGATTKGTIANVGAGDTTLPAVTRNVDGSYPTEALLARWAKFVAKHDAIGKDKTSWGGGMGFLSEERRTAGNRIGTRYFSTVQYHQMQNWTLIQTMVALNTKHQTELQAAAKTADNNDKAARTRIADAEAALAREKQLFAEEKAKESPAAEMAAAFCSAMAGAKTTDTPPPTSVYEEFSRLGSEAETEAWFKAYAAPKSTASISGRDVEAALTQGMGVTPKVAMQTLHWSGRPQFFVGAKEKRAQSRALMHLLSPGNEIKQDRVRIAASAVVVDRSSFAFANMDNAQQQHCSACLIPLEDREIREACAILMAHGVHDDLSLLGQDLADLPKSPKQLKAMVESVRGLTADRGSPETTILGGELAFLRTAALARHTVRCLKEEELSIEEYLKMTKRDPIWKAGISSTLTAREEEKWCLLAAALQQAGLLTCEEAKTLSALLDDNSVGSMVSSQRVLQVVTPAALWAAGRDCRLGRKRFSSLPGRWDQGKFLVENMTNFVALCSEVHVSTDAELSTAIQLFDAPKRGGTTASPPPPPAAGPALAAPPDGGGPGFAPPSAQNWLGWESKVYGTGDQLQVHNPTADERAALAKKRSSMEADLLVQARTNGVADWPNPGSRGAGESSGRGEPSNDQLVICVGGGVLQREGEPAVSFDDTALFYITITKNEVLLLKTATGHPAGVFMEPMGTRVCKEHVLGGGCRDPAHSAGDASHVVLNTAVWPRVGIMPYANFLAHAKYALDKLLAAKVWLPDRKHKKRTAPDANDNNGKRHKPDAPAANPDERKGPSLFAAGGGKPGKGGGKGKPGPGKGGGKPKRQPLPKKRGWVG